MMCFLGLQCDSFELKWTKAEEPSSAAEDKFGRRKCSMFGFQSASSAPERCMVLYVIGQPKLSWLVSWVMCFFDKCWPQILAMEWPCFLWLICTCFWLFLQQFEVLAKVLRVERVERNKSYAFEILRVWREVDLFFLCSVCVSSCFQR